MIIAVIGYKLGGKNLSINYDTMNKMFIVEEGYKDFDIKTGFNYGVKSRKEVRESLDRFKKSFNK